MLRHTDEVRRSRGIYDASDTDFIVDILNLPWFDRTWTVQELTLAHNAELLCGSKRLPWACFANRLRHLQVSETYFFSESFNSTEISNPGRFYSELSCYVSLRTLQETESDRNEPIITALTLVRPKAASDPRDKVYGLYGIFESMKISGLPSVDYNRTAQDVFKTIAVTLIGAEHSLNILNQMYLQPLMSDLPSWVPDCE
jgi:hypothetical protein